MKIKDPNIGIEATPQDFELFTDFLIEHLNYSIKDIKSYYELTPEEKVLIPERVFNKFCE